MIRTCLFMIMMTYVGAASANAGNICESMISLGSSELRRAEVPVQLHICGHAGKIILVDAKLGPFPKKTIGFSKKKYSEISALLLSLIRRLKESKKPKQCQRWFKIQQAFTNLISDQITVCQSADNEVFYRQLHDYVEQIYFKQ